MDEFVGIILLTRDEITQSCLRERLNANGRILEPASLHRTLLRLRRHGWLNINDSLHTITPAGRKAFKLATSGLKTLAALIDRRA